MEKWLGKKVKYTVTGCVGVCTAVAVYHTGVNRLLIEFNDSTGRPCEWWIDECNAVETDQEQA